MCGIAGVISLSGTVDKRLIESASRALAHRGPDEQGYVITDNVCLIHSRLSIIDLEGGRQPLTTQDESLCLVANGEIYNYVERFAQFARDSFTPLSQSDSESILHAYASQGLQGLTTLNGMFAFALHDKRAQKVILARDRLGIKPLYYTAIKDHLLFASEIKSLLSLLRSFGASPEIRLDGLSQFLQNQFSTGKETIFKQVYRVLPGEAIEISTKRLETTSHIYWDALTVQPRSVTFDEALADFEPLFKQVMLEHMRSDVPFGLFLSGGIDSSLLLAALHQWQDAPIKTYSLGFSGASMKDELSQAEQLAEHFNTQHTSLKVSRDDLFDRIVHSIWCTDDLMRDFASLPTSLLSERAAQDLKVVFSGEGGDEAFAGYRRYANSVDNFLKNLVKGTGGFRTRGQWPGALSKQLFSNELLACNARQPFKDLWSKTPASWSQVQRRQYVDLCSALPDNLLVKGDRIMMGFGLEGRVPFCDHRLVEFGLALPDALKMRGTVGKQLLRKWGEKVLPAEVMTRPKRGFYVPVNEWLSGDFLTQLEQKLLANAAVGDYFNIGGIKLLFAKHRHRGKHARHIWCLMQFAIWHKLFIEQPAMVPNAKENPLDWI